YTPPRRVSSVHYDRRGASHCAPLTFPTRRSSDLDIHSERSIGAVRPLKNLQVSDYSPEYRTQCCKYRNGNEWNHSDLPPTRYPRAEEHTSELQSRFDRVCGLLLEKKEARPGAGTV